MNGYAVFDIETTGFRLHPDSIVEIAVVHVDAGGEITESWDTLLRPRDGEVGPTHVHGIDRSMVSGAPAFADLADELYALFAGRIPVAHRIAQFDGRFLNAHFTWAGIATDTFTEGLCTWQLANRHLPLAHHTLKDCCGHLGIDLVGAHQALDDTLATAQLLGHFVRSGHTLTASRARVVPPSPARATGTAAAFFPRHAGSGVRLPAPTRAAQDAPVSP